MRQTRHGPEKNGNGCKMAFMLIAWTLALLLFTARPQTKASCTATGDLEIVQFDSKIFPAARKIRILLPEGYRLPENRDRRYSVLYLTDGQNLFDICMEYADNVNSGARNSAEKNGALMRLCSC